MERAMRRREQRRTEPEEKTALHGADGALVAAEARSMGS